MILLPDDLFKQAPWTTLQIMEELSQQLKENNPLPGYVSRIAAGTSGYEDVLRAEWEKFKKEPTEDNAKAFIAFMLDFTNDYWRSYLADVLGVTPEQLTPQQLQLYNESLAEHQDYLQTSLLPDIIKAIKAGVTDFNNFDYRVIFLYAGALWSLGFLATVMFDGLQIRDLADFFIFLGPNDENTCEGERGCKQHVGKVYTVAEILAKQIIPGRLRCLTSCRHILIPVVSSI